MWLTGLKSITGVQQPLQASHILCVSGKSRSVSHQASGTQPPPSEWTLMKEFLDACFQQPETGTRSSTGTTELLTYLLARLLPLCAASGSHYPVPADTEARVRAFFFLSSPRGFPASLMLPPLSTTNGFHRSLLMTARGQTGCKTALLWSIFSAPRRFCFQAYLQHFGSNKLLKTTLLWVFFC